MDVIYPISTGYPQAFALLRGGNTQVIHSMWKSPQIDADPVAWMTHHDRGYSRQGAFWGPLRGAVTFVTLPYRWAYGYPGGYGSGAPLDICYIHTVCIFIFTPCALSPSHARARTYTRRYACTHDARPPASSSRPLLVPGSSGAILGAVTSVTSNPGNAGSLLRHEAGAPRRVGTAAPVPPPSQRDTGCDKRHFLPRNRWVTL